MKITKAQLKQIIQEELAGVSEKVVKRGDKYAYVSKKGKTLGTHDTKAAAEKQATAIRISRNVGEARDYQQPEEGSVEYHIMDAIGMLQGEDDTSGTLHLVIRRLEEALDTLENDPAYNSDFVDDD